jgi:acetolactate synthase-1/2/3 large subunit
MERPEETLGERLVAWLELYGIDTVFGIPGVHTIEMYRGLGQAALTHLTPRHEQGAGFAADGYARASGRVAACFVITGPGLTNMLTPMAQAYADSVPMLVVSSVNARPVLGLEAGDLHEVRSSGRMAAHAAAFSHTLSDPAQLPDVLARAFAVFEGARPRPVHVEIPRDLFAVRVPPAVIARPGPISRAAPEPDALALAARWLRAAKRPLILAGGGCAGAAGSVTALAERTGAPVVMTVNGRGVVAAGHPLGVPASPSLHAIRRLIAEADVILALGTEWGRTDYDIESHGPFAVPGRVIRVDIDAEQLRRGVPPALAMVGDAGSAARGLVERLGQGAPAPDGAERAAAAMAEAMEEIGPNYRASVAFLDAIRAALPAAPVVGDSTNAIYAGNELHALPAPRLWFNAATGYGALGYGLPAAIGAARATGGPVVCIAGDGGVQFTLSELGLAVEARLPVILIVWNNRGYGEIGRYMDVAGVTRVGVDLVTPDFLGIARAYGAAAARLDTLDALPTLLAEGARRPGPTVIELDERLVVG